MNNENENNDHFVSINLSTEQIFKIIHKLTNQFKTDKSFSSWCAKTDLSFLTIGADRKTRKLNEEKMQE